MKNIEKGIKHRFQLSPIMQLWNLAYLFSSAHFYQRDPREYFRYWPRISSQVPAEKHIFPAFTTFSCQQCDLLCYT